MTAPQRPGSAGRALRRLAAPVRLLASPLQRFLAIERASSLVLVAATAAAIVLANSGARDAYASWWQAELGGRPLSFWIDDVLMTIFFFVAGLEIRRELEEGELSDPRRAALPAVAALGGMLAPAAIYAAINHGGLGARGWGIPMATDIAFAVGALALLGRRVPGALRVLLLALAVIDDIGAIVVIAVFYSAGVDVEGLVLAAAGVAAVLVARRARVPAIAADLAGGAVVWLGLHRAGVHPTLAGVAIGLLAPPSTWAGRVGHRLHALVAFAIMPLFAFASAGVSVAGADLGSDATIFAGVALGLVIGKPLGILVASWASARAGLTAWPRGVGAASVLVVGAVGGIGFTMSLFVAQLAFPPGPALATAKLGILVGSLTASAVGLTLGRAILRPPRPGEPPLADEAAAEASTID
ncbi:MAG TPA: Na+/H+ antiporter NhaA [Kofleriaceae bacterium]|nr:Na+/H+ antiporter NhaA [Kofleriaceae bacterium]